MEKLGCLIGIIIACLVTILVLTTDVGTFEHTVTFSTQETALKRQQELLVNPSKVSLNNSGTNITNKEVTADNRGLDIELKQFDNRSVNYYNAPANGENRSVHFYDTSGSVTRSEINNLKAGFGSGHTLTPMNHYTTKPATTKSVTINYGSQGTNYRPYNTNYSSQKTTASQPDEGRYVYKNLDWSKWRSNFINRITDDSIYITELDKYPQGTMFQYSFEVDSSGKVYNVKVRSFQLSREDKEKVVSLIESYSYKEITRFPPKSNRKSTKVSAILLLSDKTEYATPGDFNDFEQIKIKM